MRHIVKLVTFEKENMNTKKKKIKREPENESEYISNGAFVARDMGRKVH